MQQAKDIALTKIGEVVRSEAQLRSPVQTGNLRDSNDYRVEEDSVVVGNSADYSLWVHEGTSRNRAQPFLENAVMENTSKLNHIVTSEYKAKLKG